MDAQRGPAPSNVSLWFHYHRLRREATNLSLLLHRDYTGFLVSMHQSGTHWLKHMLASAIAQRYGLPPPQFSHANDIIGGPRDPWRYAAAPRLAASHSIPHVLVGSRTLRRLMRFPRYVVLVRDIRASLVANYEKWKEHYRCSFSEFLRGDASGRRFNHDIWWSIRFCNGWGRVSARSPGQTLVVRYEDLCADALRELRRIDAFWGLQISDRALLDAIAASSKEKLAEKMDPVTAGGLTVVRRDSRPFQDCYGDGDRVFVSDACRRLLRTRFGYDYEDWQATRSS